MMATNPMAANTIEGMIGTTRLGWSGMTSSNRYPTPLY
jgi:hypothetical protein